MSDSSVSGATQPAGEAAYVPLDRPDALAVCTRCGAVVEGDVTGQNRHDIWHDELARAAGLASRARALGRVGDFLVDRTDQPSGEAWFLTCRDCGSGLWPSGHSCPSVCCDHSDERHPVTTWAIATGMRQCAAPGCACAGREIPRG